MRSMLVVGCALLASLAAGTTARAQTGRVWFPVDEASLGAGLEGRRIATTTYQVVGLDRGALLGVLERAPMELTPDAGARAVVLALPWPSGGLRRFRIEESPIMEPALALKFPELKTYKGQGLDEPAATARLDWTPKGFHAIAFSEEGTVYVDPYAPGDTAHYRSFFRHDYYRTDGEGLRCLLTGEAIPPRGSGTSLVPPTPQQGPHGGTLRTYRLAMAATAEYTAFHGGTVPLALAAIATSMNRVNGIYERDLAVRMILIGNNNLIVYTNPTTDPYTNNDGFAMLAQNQTNVDAVIGSANYDVGHVFSTGGGGIATLNSPCNASLKARGVTGSFAPVGDAFDVDYVAHEMGHQFGGPHTFNGTTGACAGGNRSAANAFEPGSGSTIQAYAGICGAENLQPNSDAYFHAGSQDDMLAFITGAGNACSANSATGNTPPTVNAGADYTIPRSTPFALTAAGSDVNGDSLTYTWEQMDAGAAAPPNTDDGTRAIFRSFSPTGSPTRTFPKLSDILNNTSSFGESLPTTTRAMSFRVTVRDNRAGGGGTASDDMLLSVRADSGPFLVTQPNTPESWPGTSIQTISWDVAGTTAAPVSCANVRISMSTDGGLTFPYLLADSTPNDGTELLPIPNLTAAAARIKVEAVGNVFFDVSNTNFSTTRSVVAANDYEADDRADIAVFHAATGLWYVRISADGSVDNVGFGGVGYTPVARDYDGDGKTDVAVYHAASGLWFIRRSTDLTTFTLGFGGSGYTPVPEDYDGDGKADIAAYHEATGLWFIRQSSNLATLTLGYGGSGYVPVPKDYDGDGKADVAVFHPASGLWFIRQSTTSTTLTVGYGGTGYTPVPRDYDGDGKADIAVYHESSGLWFLRRSIDAVTVTVGYGGSGYSPVPADYDGDGKADVAVYHGASGLWFLRRSIDAVTVTVGFGGTGFAAVNN